MSIASEISRLQTAKADLKTSIQNKGVTVPTSAKLDDYADYVDSIQTGGGSPNIQSLSVTTNGTYNAPNGVDGYNPVFVSVPSAGANTCTLSISDDGIVASNFSSGTVPANYVAVGHDEINSLWVTYCKNEHESFSIAWFDPDGVYVISGPDAFPTLVNTMDSSNTTMYSELLSDTSFTATVIE